MATFHQFSCLPTELRLRVWELTVEPRTVDARVERRFCPAQSLSVFYLASSSPVPAPLHTCQEARSHGLYRRVFSDLSATNSEEPRYIWANLELDMIDIGETIVECFRSAASSIQRLKFTRKNSDEYFYHFEAKDLRMFTNLKEAHVVCADSIRAWWDAATEHYWPCGAENLYFIDPDNGTMMRSIELDEMCEKEQREAWAQEIEESPELQAQYGDDGPSR